MNRRGVLGGIAGALATPFFSRLGLVTATTVSPKVGLEFAEDGLPYRASSDRQSAYYWDSPANLIVLLSFNGRNATGMNCWEWDRREGWILCDDDHGLPLPRRYGVVKVRLP